MIWKLYDFWPTAVCLWGALGPILTALLGFAAAREWYKTEIPGEGATSAEDMPNESPVS